MYDPPLSFSVWSRPCHHWLTNAALVRLGVHAVAISMCCVRDAERGGEWKWCGGCVLMQARRIALSVHLHHFRVSYAENANYIIIAFAFCIWRDMRGYKVQMPQAKRRECWRVFLGWGSHPIVFWYSSKLIEHVHATETISMDHARRCVTASTCFCATFTYIVTHTPLSSYKVTNFVVCVVIFMAAVCATFSMQ